MKVLIADDSLTDLTLARRLVERWGYQVVSVDDGNGVMEALQDAEIRLALVDWMMPGADGIEICRKIQELDRFVYAIMVTGRSTSEDIVHALECGASDFVAKPYDANDLRARLRVGERIANLQTQLLQAQKMESIGQLAAGIAHEINTPTQYVGDNVQFLEQSFQDLSELLKKYQELLAAADSQETLRELAAEVREAVERADLEYLVEEVPRAIAQAQEGIGRIASIVGAMKEFSHPGTAEKTATDVNRAVEAAATVTRNEWKYASELELELDASLPPVPCLTGELNQALLNLIVNAAHAVADAVEAGRFEKGTIRIQTRTDGDWCEIRVSDTGMGISPEIRPRIFEPFFTTKPVGAGTGQGLAIVHSAIVDKHGGEIHVESEVGTGTTFALRLPLREST